jgi:antitoxin component YwqK of YwqJK toxin-antitoxin module
MVAALLGLLLHVSAAAQGSADNGLNRLKRKIKSDLNEHASYKYESGTWLVMTAFFVEHTFSPEGKVLLQTSYNRDGSNRHQFEMFYDGEGRISEKRHYTADGNLADSCVITYNSSGKIDSSICKTPAGKVLLDHKYKYDAEGREIEFLFWEKGFQPIRKVHTYDDKGNLLETVSYGGDKPIPKETYSYDSGRKTRRTIFRLPTGETAEEIAIYNSEGKPAEYIYSLNGAPTQRKVVTYNPGGTYAEEAFYLPDGKLTSKTTYEYKYDREANFIASESKTTTVEGEPTSKTVTKRTITYDEEISPKPKDLASKQGVAKKLKPRR